MNTLPEHARNQCNELVTLATEMVARVKQAKRLPTIEEMQIELAALQLDLGAVKNKAAEVKAYVCSSFVIAGAHEHVDEIQPRTESPRIVPAFPDHPVQPPPEYHQTGVNA